MQICLVFPIGMCTVACPNKFIRKEQTCSGVKLKKMELLSTGRNIIINNNDYCCLSNSLFGPYFYKM